MVQICDAWRCHYIDAGARTREVHWTDGNGSGLCSTTWFEVVSHFLLRRRWVWSRSINGGCHDCWSGSSFVGSWSVRALSPLLLRNNGNENSSRAVVATSMANDGGLRRQ